MKDWQQKKVELGKRLRASREGQGLRLIDIEQRDPKLVSPSIHAMERADKNYTIDNLLKYAKALGWEKVQI